MVTNRKDGFFTKLALAAGSGGLDLRGSAWSESALMAQDRKVFKVGSATPRLMLRGLS